VTRPGVIEKVETKSEVSTLSQVYCYSQFMAAHRSANILWRWFDEDWNVFPRTFGVRI